MHDYTRRSGVVSSHIIVPDQHPDWASDRDVLWNAAEQTETRKNSVVAREIEVALPAELSPAARERLATEYTAHIVDRYQVAAEVSVHLPGRGGDQRNHHAHILISTRRLDESGFTDKTREIDDKKSGPEEIERIRKDWEVFQNRALERAGQEKRVDCRSLLAQRIEVQERADEMENLALAAGAQAERAWRPGKRERYAEEAQSLQAQAAMFRTQAANLDRKPGRHQGRARIALQRRFQERFEQMRAQLSERFERVHAAFQDKVQSMRERLDRVSERVFSQGRRITLEQQVQRRAEVIKRSEQRVRQGDWDENTLWKNFDVLDVQDLRDMDDERFAHFEELHDDITYENEVLDRIARAEAKRTVQDQHEQYRQLAADRQAAMRREKAEGASAPERAVKDPHENIRRAGQDNDVEQKARQDRETRARKDRSWDGPEF